MTPKEYVDIYLNLSCYLDADTQTFAHVRNYLQDTRGTQSQRATDGS